MNWIFDHFQIVVLVVLALGSWAKRRMDANRAEQDERQARREIMGEDEMSGPDDGWPQAQAVPSMPSPKAGQSASPPRPPPVPSSPLGGLYQTAALLERLSNPIDPLEKQEPPREAAKATTTGGAAATRTRVSAAQRHVHAVPHVKGGLRASLHNRNDIRRAVLMREILGPPLGLR